MEYEEAKRLAAAGSERDRSSLAARSDMRPEILYFLAEDKSNAVRRAIAGNAATPRQADLRLARDADEGVRELLAVKIGQLAPDLPQETRSQVRDLTIQVLETLARDQAVKVRRIVAEALKDLTDAPPHIIQELARDLEIRVAGPVLQYSPILSDSDLLEIISSGPIRGALSAIARRAQIGERLADAIIAAAIEAPEESETITALLNNRNTAIREETLDIILDKAPAVEEWQEPLVKRPLLPMNAIRRLADFVSSSLFDLLQARPDLDRATAKAVAKAVKKRLAAESRERDAARNDAPPPPGDAEAMSAAIAGGKQEQVAAALARDAILNPAIVRKILTSMSAKAVTALAWKAGLTMRQALQLQLKIAGIAPHQVLNPRGGTDYPLSEREMEWQLELFTG
ncbi:uncharacterized protein (DUF2336 family) [Dongia mobilis]|uniref:Uncharacterized protein (DUF2336 family) n=1 Tax=Dongia mobilis TaxID=578943 RepID=A0A4R6WWK6_9PROT|nr:DUF2336 domain-containing protein [Dongia mobilis]TDQ86483.1 uncharacterized protein (DUF2336 family) [Dongia mobilis]